MKKNSNVPAAILGIAGLVMVIAVVIWGRAGFYTSDLPVMIILLAAGAACGIIATKIKTKNSKRKIQPLDDKNKCGCGAYNDKAAEVCWNCGKRLRPEASDTYGKVAEPVSPGGNSITEAWTCSCGKVNDKNAAFCIDCGKRKVVQEPADRRALTETWTCSCGKVKDKNAAF